MAASAPRMGPSHGIAQRLRVREPLDPRGRGNSVSSVLYGFKHVPRPYGAHVTRAMSPEPCSPAQYVSVSLATCVGLCRFGEAWAALWAENLLTYLAQSRVCCCA